MFKEREVRVFVICGFLESGKTTFIQNAIIRDPEMKKERALIIRCEEGEVEYDCIADNIHLHAVEEKEELTGDLFFKLDEKYKPTYVIIEYNGMWGMEALYSVAKPKRWRLVDQLTMFDATTFAGYYANMKSIFADMLRTSTTVVVNRCTRQDDFKFYKDSIKRAAPQVNIMYLSDEEGMLDIMLEEDLPYSLKDDVIFLDDDGFVVWYIDMLDNPSRYVGKTVQYVAEVAKPPYCRPDTFFAGNMVMTCCEDDMQFLGYVCRSDKTSALSEGDYVRVRAQIRFEFAPEYQNEGPVLYATKLTPVKKPGK